MFPENSPQASANPVSEGPKPIPRFGKAEVAPPPTDVLHEFADNLPDTASTTTSRYFTNSFLKAFYALPVNSYLRFAT